MTATPAPRELIPLAQWLVGQDTTTGTPGERETLAALAAHAVGLLGSVGVVREDSDSAAFVVIPADAGEEPLLLFACHLDTVPIGDLGAWVHPPHSGVVDDGHLHGRGASDMKSGLAAAFVAVVDGLRAGSRVALAVTTGEEAGCLGADAAVALLADRSIGAVVIPESTGNRVALGHRGAFWLTARARGVAAHGSTPAAGTNAVLALAETVGDLATLPLRTHPALGAESVNVGAFTGGEVHNIVPARASASIDHRVVDADTDAISHWWARRVDEVSVDLRLDPVWTDPDDAWVRSLPAPLADGPVAYFTDASVLVRHLPAGVPIVVWGPGDPAVVHTTAEKVALRAIEDARAMYRAAIDDWPATSSTRPAADAATDPTDEGDAP